MREKQHGNAGNTYALKGESVASKNINIRIQPTLLNAAKQRAKENNVPFSVWLLRVINKELAAQQQLSSMVAVPVDVWLELLNNGLVSVPEQPTEALSKAMQCKAAQEQQ